MAQEPEPEKAQEMLSFYPLVPQESQLGGWWQRGWPERSTFLERLQVTTLACSQDCSFSHSLTFLPGPKCSSKPGSCAKVPRQAVLSFHPSIHLLIVPLRSPEVTPSGNTSQLLLQSSCQSPKFSVPIQQRLPRKD